MIVNCHGHCLTNADFLLGMIYFSCTVVDCIMSASQLLGYALRIPTLTVHIQWMIDRLEEQLLELFLQEKGMYATTDKVCAYRQCVSAEPVFSKPLVIASIQAIIAC